MPKPSIPQGTRDFSAAVVRKRNYIFSVIKNVFELYGFEPLETPAMENLETLTGKYGEEGDKLIYRILDSGNPFDEHFKSKLANIFDEPNSSVIDEPTSSVFDESNSIDLAQPNSSPLAQPNSSILSDLFENPLFLDGLKKNQNKLKNEITGKALKYDLTIPFARYVAMNHTKLTFPFRRYQIQPVWRADRPQRGRYREFTQCDADVVGSTSLLNEVELANIYHDVLTQLGFTNYELRINSRKILAALAELCGGADKMMDITIAIDKLDKIGIDKVKEELQQRGLNDEQVAIIDQYLNISGSNAEKLSAVSSLLSGSAIAATGIDELKYVADLAKNTNIIIDLTLARGLNYYTGMIFEAKAPKEVNMGSIGGGGRYDDLTGLFGVQNIPGVGISFGVDRIYDVMEELSLFPEVLQVGSKALFFNMGEKESAFAFGIMQQMRSRGIACELYHEETKVAKQFSYAEKKSIPFVVIIGSREMADNNCQVKNLGTGEQLTLSFEKLADLFKSAGSV